jgi:hypothetical protein
MKTLHFVRGFDYFRIGHGMVVWRDMVKVTFTIDEDTANTLRRISKRVDRSQSQVLREAIRHYEPHAGQLSAQERKARVELFDRVIAGLPKSPASKVDAELREIRSSRREGWRRKAKRSG